MQLIDTHCHIHSADYTLDRGEVITSAADAGVVKMLCVGTDLEDSELAVEFVQTQSLCWATIGIHPHEAVRYHGNTEALDRFKRLAERPKVVAVGETGLDYYYSHSPHNLQKDLLRLQIELALGHDLPLVFHVREAFSDFWPIFDAYKGIRGVVHSFSATNKELDQVLDRGLYVGLNGIMTFTKDAEQLEAAKMVPLEKLLLETDAPYLTPVPYRGTICQPKHVGETAKFLAQLKGVSLETLASATTANAQKLFGI